MRLAWWTRRWGEHSIVWSTSPVLTTPRFATGWNYFFKYAFATPTNLTAAGLLVQYWRPDLNVAIWITIFGVAVILINVSGLSCK